MSDQMRITASSFLLSLNQSRFDPYSKRQRRMPEESSKLSTILHWISIVISPDAAVSLSCDVSSNRFTFYLSSNSLRDASMTNATRLLDILRKSLLIASTGGNQSDLEDEYLTFVTDTCWYRLQDKVNKIPHFPLVPDHADVSTKSSVLKTIIGQVEAWNTWRTSSGLPAEGSQKITEMQRKLDHSRTFDTLKHCFEQVFHPLDDAGDRQHQLRQLWHCCYALMTSDFFVDVFNERWGEYCETCFLYRVYRRLWRLFFYRKGVNVLLYGRILTSITQGCYPSPPEITFCWIPRDSPSTIQMVGTPEQFIFQAGQRYGWQGDLAQDSHLTSQARCLWSENETKNLNVHPIVSLVNFLYSSDIQVMENCIGSSRRPCALCEFYIFLRGWRWLYICSRSSKKFRVDWSLPQMLGRTLTRKKAEKMIAEIIDYAEAIACAHLSPPFKLEELEDL
jgi:hypothetical protein